MKRTFLLLLLVLMCFCIANAEVYYYVPQGADPATMTEGNVIVLIKDNSSKLWLCSCFISDFRRDIMRDASFFVNHFNKATYSKYSKEQVSSFDGGAEYVGAVFYLLKLEQNLTKCQVYNSHRTGQFISPYDVEFTLKNDLSVLVEDSDKPYPQYFKRVSLSDFKIRRNQDDLF